MRKLRYREGKWEIQAHVTAKLRFELRTLNPELMILSTPVLCPCEWVSCKAKSEFFLMWLQSAVEKHTVTSPDVTWVCGGEQGGSQRLFNLLQMLALKKGWGLWARTWPWIWLAPECFGYLWRHWSYLYNRGSLMQICFLITIHFKQELAGVCINSGPRLME